MLIAETFINVIKNFQLGGEARNLIETIEFCCRDTNFTFTFDKGFYSRGSLFFFSVSILNREWVTRLQATIYRPQKLHLGSKRTSVLSLYFRRGIENNYELSETRDKSALRTNVIDVGRVSRVTLLPFKIWHGYAIWHTVCYLARFLNVISIYTQRHNRNIYTLVRCAWLQSMQHSKGDIKQNKSSGVGKSQNRMRKRV